MRLPKLVSENLRGNTLALNVESSLNQMLVFKDTSNSILHNSVFIVRSVAKATTVMLRLSFIWINTKELSISVNIAPEHSTRHKIEIIIILFIQNNTVSHAIYVTKDLTRKVNSSSIARTICVKIEIFELIILNSRFKFLQQVLHAPIIKYSSYSSIFVQSIYQAKGNRLCTVKFGILTRFN